MNLKPDTAVTADFTAASGRRISPVLVVAFVISLALHGVLLATGFIDFPQPQVREHERGLEVTLVNARGQKPDEAQMLAQTDLDAGGTSEQAPRPTTPAAAQESPRDGDSLTDARPLPVTPSPAETEALTRQEPEPDTTRMQPSEPGRPAQPPLDRATPSGRDLMDSISAVARLETQIDRSLNEYAERPRKRFIGARTREYRFAQYVENWRQKVERVGTLNYPDAARGRTYGTLLLSVVIRADGSVEEISVRRSSGAPVLDEAAVRIVKLAAPFAPFPPNIREDTDVIEITRTWTFTNSEQLRTH